MKDKAKEKFIPLGLSLSLFLFPSPFSKADTELIIDGTDL